MTEPLSMPDIERIEPARAAYITVWERRMAELYGPQPGGWGSWTQWAWWKFYGMAPSFDFVVGADFIQRAARYLVDEEGLKKDMAKEGTA